MNSYLVQYEVKTIITEKTIIKVVDVKKLGVQPIQSLRKPSRHPVVELAKLYTELGSTTDPVERARIIAEIGVIKCGDW